MKEQYIQLGMDLNPEAVSFIPQINGYRQTNEINHSNNRIKKGTQVKASNNSKQ